jgi:hypothetical protein
MGASKKVFCGDGIFLHLTLGSSEVDVAKKIADNFSKLPAIQIL